MTFHFDCQKDDVREVFRQHEQGAEILCAHCGNPLLVVLTLEDARKHKILPGIYCQQDKKHCDLRLSLQDTDAILAGFKQKKHQEPKTKIA